MITTSVALSALMLTGCMSMKENMVEQGLTELAALYETEDIDGIRAGTAPGHVRILPDGTELSGEALDAYVVSLLAANDNIKIELQSLAVSKDRIFVEYIFEGDAVGPSSNGPDMTGHHFVNRVVSIMELDGREIVQMRDYWDSATYAKVAGYELMIPPAEPEAPAAATEAPEAAPESDESAEDAGSQDAAE